MSKKQKVEDKVSWEALRSSLKNSLKNSAKENFESSKLQVEQQLQQAPVDCNSKLEECKAANKVSSMQSLELAIGLCSSASEAHDKLESDMDGLLSQLQRIDNSSSFLMRTIKDEEKLLSCALDGKDKGGKGKK